jgi:hypothetical protein
MRLYNFHRFPLPLIWILIIGLFIDAINVYDIIGLHGWIQEEYDGESMTADIANPNIDISYVNNRNTNQVFQNKHACVSHGIQWIDEDSPSLEASVIFEGEELILLVQHQSKNKLISSFIPSTSPVSLGKLLI